MITAEKQTTFIEIRETKNGRKIASLLMPDAGEPPTLTFARDNSTLYYSWKTIGRWPRKEWKVGQTKMYRDPADGYAYLP